MGHRFSYEVTSLLIGLDRLDQADRQSRLFGVNRAALDSFRPCALTPGAHGIDLID